MIFELLWALIGFFSIVGYLILWIQQWRNNNNPLNSRYANSNPQLPIEDATNLTDDQPHDIPNKPDHQITDLDLDSIGGVVPDSKDEYVLDLDDMDGDDINGPYLHYQRSFDCDPDDIGQSVTEIVTDDDFVTKRKISLKSRYYTICTINCEGNPAFIREVEKTPLCIEDADNIDYWAIENHSSAAIISIVPRCCLSTSVDDSKKNSNYSINQNRPTASIRQEASKEEEAQAKRKYAVTDMIESEREYCANIRLIRDILASVDESRNPFQKELLKLFNSLKETISKLVEVHEMRILPNLSTCTLTPANVAIVLLGEKSSLKSYDTARMQWKNLKIQIEQLSQKQILLKNNSNYNNTKISTTSLIDMMTKVDEKLFQYSTFLCDIMRYTGRVGDDIYELQKAMTMINRIERIHCENSFLISLLKTENDLIKNERIVRMTESVTVSEPYMIKKNGEVIKMIKEKPHHLMLLKSSLMMIEKEEADINTYKIIKIKSLKIFQRNNDKDNKMIIWSQHTDGDQEIFILHFKTIISKQTWLYEIKRRLNKNGKSDINVNSEDFDNKYKKFVLKSQRLAAIEIETVSLESATVDVTCGGSSSDLYKEMAPSIENIFDINFESAIMKTPKTFPSTLDSVTSAKPKMAIVDTCKSTNGRSPDSLDDEIIPSIVATVNPDVLITSDLKTIEIDEDSDISWSLTFHNFDIKRHSIDWFLSDQLLNQMDPNVSIKLNQGHDNIYDCQFCKKTKLDYNGGKLSCIIVDKLSGNSLTSSIVNVIRQPSVIEVELKAVVPEIRVKENECVELIMKVLKTSTNELKVENFKWCKDKEIISLDNVRSKCSLHDGHLVLRIAKVNKSDTGVYTIESYDVNKLVIKNRSSISVTVEISKKTVYQTAGQENAVLLEQTDLNNITPLKEEETILGFSDENPSNDSQNPLIITSNITNSSYNILRAKSDCFEIDEGQDLELEVDLLESINEAPKWFFNNETLRVNDNIILSNDNKTARLIVKACLKAQEGIYKCSVRHSRLNSDESVCMSVKVIEKESGGFLECDIEEMDLISGEVLKLNLHAVNIEETILKHGCWYLNSEILDLEAIQGEFMILNGVLSLYIPDVTANIRGILQFKIEQSKQFCSPEIDIKIREAQGNSMMSKKADLKKKVINIIKTKCNSIEVDEFSDAVLDIGFLGQVNTHPKWYFNGDPLSTNDCIQCIFNADNLSARLLIQNCVHSNEGTYRCSVINPENGTEENVDIIVKVVQKKIFPFLDCDIEEIDLETGETLMLNIHAMNIDEAILQAGSWFLNSNILDLKSIKGEFKVFTEMVTLSIPDVTTEIRGILQFKIPKPIGLHSPAIEIKIRDVNPRPSKSNKDDLKLKEIKSHLEVTENDQLSLEMDILSGTVSMYKLPKWSLNGIDITEQGANMTLKTNSCRLSIPSCKTKDAGNYRCVFLPKQGYQGEAAIALFTVVVKEAKSVLDDKNLKEIISPLLQAKIVAIEIDEYKDAILEVNLLGKIETDPKWYFNGNLQTTNEHCQIIFEGDKQSAMLIIKRCLKSQEGMYKCSVINPGNGLEESVDINLKIVVAQHSGYLDCDIEEIDLEIGEILKLNMHVVDIPKSVLEGGFWFLNSKKLDINLIKGNCTVLDDILSLYIPDVTRDIRGILQYKIDKPLGLCSPEIEIKIRDVDNKNKKLTNDKLKLKEVNSYQEVMENEELVLEIEIVSGNLSMYQPPKWSLDNVEIVESSGSMILKKNSCKLCLPSDKSKYSGNYQCKFLPRKGVLCEPGIASFTVVVKELKRQLTAKIIQTKPTRVEVDENNQVVLKVEFLGEVNEVPEWYFNNLFLETKDNIKVVVEEDKLSTSLIIEKCRKSQEGMYTCIVVNPGNSLEEKVDLTLKVTQTQSTGFLDCDIEEIDLESGEILKLNMHAVAIDESVLQSGCWFLNSKLLNLDLIKGESVVSKETLSLYIPNVTTSIKGILQFKIEKPIRLYSPEIEIKIREVKKKLEKPDNSNNLKLKEMRSNLEVFEDEELILEIEILSGNLSKYESPKLSLNNVAVVESSYKMVLESNIYKLAFPPNRSKGSGHYKCTFLPKKGFLCEPGIASFDVIVKKSKLQSIIPIIKTKCTVIEVDEFKKAVLAVELTSQIVTCPKWYFNNFLLTEKDNVQIEFNEDHLLSKLNIQSCLKSQEGIYKCVVINPGDGLEENVDITLKVVQTQNTGFLDCDIEEIDLESGETLKLKMNAVGIEESILKSGHWYLNSKIFNMNSVNGESVVSNDVLILYIPEVTTDIRGILQFKIDKPKCLNSPEIEIKIRNVSKKIAMKTINEDLKLKDFQSQIEIVENDELILQIEILSGNVANYQSPRWSLNEIEIVDARFIRTFDGNHCKLSLTSSQPKDAGVYKCTFTPRRDAKVKPVTSTFSAVIKERRRMLTVQSSNIQVTEGDCAMLLVDSEGFSENDIKWSVLSKTENLNNDRFTKQFNKNHINLKIDNVKKEDAGTYICKGFSHTELKSEVVIALTIIPYKEKKEKYWGKFEKDLYIVGECDDVVMKVIVNSDGDPFSVLWYFDSELLVISPDISTSIPDNGCIAELRVTKCSTKRAGLYQCVVVHEQNEVLKTKTILQVNLKLETKNVKIHEGDALKLDVPLRENISDCIIQWSKDDKTLENSPDFIEVKTEELVSLYKEKALMAENGRYKFSCLQSFKILREIEFLVKIEARIKDKIALICDEREVLANEMEPLILSVEVDKWQKATVQWFLNNVPFGDSCNLDNQFIDLYIQLPQRHLHSGIYKCQVTTTSNEVSFIEIHVQFAEMENEYAENDELLSCTVEEVDLVEGYQLQLSVHSKENIASAPTPVWYKDQSLLNVNDSRISLVQQTNNYNLKVNNVMRKDSGTYCLQVGDNSIEIVVRVRPKPSEAGKQDVTKSVKAPKIKLNLKDIELECEPQAVKFELEIEQCGPAKALWYFEGEEIEAQNSELIQSSNNNCFYLSIPKADERHCGKYSIKVANEIGQVKSDARLSLILKAKGATLAQQMPEYIEESCCIAPIFAKKLKSLDLSSGEVLHLNCRVMSEPQPKIVWTRNGVSLDIFNSSSHIEIVNNFPNYDLIISDVSVEDSGQYCCIASNFLGDDTTNAFVTIDGNDIDGDDDSEPTIENNKDLIQSTIAPIIKAVSSKYTECARNTLSDGVDPKLTYSIEEQNLNKGKSLTKDINDTFCPLPASELVATESPVLRCVANTESNCETVSNVVSIALPAKAPTIPAIKPTISMKDASCATIFWQNGKSDDQTTDDSLGKMLYCLEMKDNPKDSWQVVSNEISENEYSLSLEPGVSYMFRVSAFNNHGISEPTPSAVIRTDRLKLVPDFSSNAPWLLMQGQPCLKWRAASVPDFCDNCVPGIMPEYKVEYRSGRLSPWQTYLDNITQCQVVLTPDVVNSAQELRVSCRNKFGQNGPTRTYKLQSNILGKTDIKEQTSKNKIPNIIDTTNPKKAEIFSITKDGLILQWDTWVAEHKNLYTIQKKSSYSNEWESFETNICSESHLVKYKPSEICSGEFRILATEDEGGPLYDGYNKLIVPSKEQLIPLIPENLKVVVKINSHELSWTPSNNPKLVDLPLVYIIQYKVISNLWITLTDKLDDCYFINDKIADVGSIFYRLSARNVFGSSDWCKEIHVKSPLNKLGKEQIVKSIRYFVIDCEKLEIKWQLCDLVFDNGLNVDDLCFDVEKKEPTKLPEWAVVGSCAGRCSILIGSTFEEENMFRIQPFLDSEKLTPSRTFRIYITKELLVPDMSFTKPDIITDSLKDYFIEWAEPSIECGFSPEGLEICSISIMMTDLKYTSQYYTGEIVTTRRIRTKDTETSQWKTIKDDIMENNVYWENPDPTQEYAFRIVPRNQFGEGKASRIAKLRPQITIPDFSLVRLTIDDQTKLNDIIMSWTAPKVNLERYTPYSIDVQYRPKGSASDEKWTTLIYNVKKSNVSICELDSTVDYELRIVPVTEFGSGKPSMTIRKPKRHVQDATANKRTAETEPAGVVNDVYVSLSQDAELKFNKTYMPRNEDLIWLKDDKPLNLNDDKVKLFCSDKGTFSLLIKHVKEDNIGSYSVMSKNNDLLQCIRLIVSDAPTFLSSPFNRSVNLHDNVSIVFKIDGYPAPTVTWRKNWKKLYSSYRTNITEDLEQSRYALRISKCILSDSGEYCVRAENVVGSVEVKFNLRIDTQPEMKAIQANEGDVNDRYYVVKQISRGHYSTCQLMVEKSTHREFVGKVFGINNIGIGKKEFESIRNVRQRNIVELFDGILNSTEYLILVYERLEGVFLINYISNLSHWNEQQAQMIIYQLVQAISHLHSHGIGHLDIQPCNIMITGKLLDTLKLFGFSNATKEDDLEICRNQLLVSTFSAPEILKGEPLSLKCDVWSLGVLSVICLQGHFNMGLKNGSDIEDRKGLLSEASCDFVAGCLDADSLNRLSSLEAVRHEWFTNTVIDYNASLDHLKDDIVKMMTYPEEMVLNFSADLQSAIENVLIHSKPKLSVESLSSSPSFSQLSSRASSVSRDGINYDRLDQMDEPITEASISYGNINENLQPVDEKYVPNSARELMFTVPLKDQTFTQTSFGYTSNSVILTCQLTQSSNESISISWYRNQELLSDGSRSKLEVLNGGFLSCTLENPGESDAGIYRCVVRNRLLRAETSARLLIGDIPAQPSQPVVLLVNENDVLLKWMPNLLTNDDIIYRVDLKEINATNKCNNWKTIGFSVDNQYLIENCPDLVCVIRVVAQNKYGCSSYSVASSAFQNKPGKLGLTHREIIVNKEWMCLTRQSKDSNCLHDLIKDISSNDITSDIINKYFTSQGGNYSDVKVLSLTKPNVNYPDYIVQRNIGASFKCPVIDLCLRIKYDHFPIIYGIVNDPTLSLHYSIEEFVPGGDLISVLLARSMYSEFTVVTILRQLMETVQFIHSNNILHTNINPSNVLIARRTNQLYDIKLIGLHHCQSFGVSLDTMNLSYNVAQTMSTFQAPEFRYENITKPETDIWSIGTLAFLLLTTQLPTIEDVCTESETQCAVKNSNTLHLPTMHTHFRTPELTLLSKFSKGARKFVYNTLKRNPGERGNADYWLAHSWFRQDLAMITEMQLRQIVAAPLVEFMTFPV